jgi:hypothetical protein
MKRQRAFMDNTSNKRAKVVSIVPLAPKLNASQRLQVARMIKKDTEMKSFGAGAAVGAVSSTAFVQDLSAIAIGTDDNTRIGNHVHLKRSNFRFRLDGADPTNTFRIILFKWKDNDFYTGNPAASAILANLSAGAGDVVMPYNRETPGSYTIIKDFFLTTSATGENTVTRYVSIPLSGKIQYTGATTNGLNKIFLLLLSDSTVIAHPTITWFHELLYTDE